MNKSYIVNLNLRTQKRCFEIYDASIGDNLNWRSQIDLFIKEEMSEIHKLLFEFAGTGAVKRIGLVKFIMKRTKMSYATAHRKIVESLLLGEIYSNGLLRQSKLSLKPFFGVKSDETT